MKKRFSLIVTAVLFALSCVIGLVACNKGGGSEVTESGWTSAIESVEENKSYTFTVKKGDVAYTYNADAEHERYHVAATKDGVSQQAIYAKEGETYYVYTEADAVAGAVLFAAASEMKWTKTEITEEEFDLATAECRMMIAIVVAAKDNFDLFTYNAEQKKYTAENMTLGSVGTADKITAVFEDGVLVSFGVQGFTAAGSDEKTDYNYGGAASNEVVVPEIGEEKEGRTTVTAEEWAAAMNFEIGDNFSVKIPLVLEAISELYMGEVTIRHDGLNWHCKFVEEREECCYDAYYKLTEDENAESGYRCQMLQVGGEGYPEFGTGGDTNGEWIDTIVPWEWWKNPVELRTEIEIRMAYAYFDLWRSIKMDGFTYDEEKQCYVNSGSAEFGLVPEEEEYVVNSGAEVQFKNGKVVRISFVEKLLSGGKIFEVPYEITFFDYGTTTVTFPSES